MRWFQVVVALLGGVLCEGVHVLLYVLRGMPYSEPRGYSLPTPLAVDLGMFAPVVVIAVLAVFLWLVGARWRRSLGGAFVAYIGGVCTYQFTRSLNPFFSIGSDSVFQNYEVQVITLIVGGVILCGGLVARNPSYSWRTAPVLLGTCVLGYIALVNGLRFVSFEFTGWFYPAVYISTCTLYGIIIVLAWHEPVYDDLGEGDYTLGSGGEAPAYAGEAPAHAPERRSPYHPPHRSCSMLLWLIRGAVGGMLVAGLMVLMLPASPLARWGAGASPTPGPYPPPATATSMPPTSTPTVEPYPLPSPIATRTPDPNATPVGTRLVIRFATNHDPSTLRLEIDRDADGTIDAVVAPSAIETLQP